MNLGIEEEGTNKLWLLHCPRLPLDSPTFKGPGHAVMGFLCWEDRELIISHTLVSDCRFGVSPVNYPDPDPQCTCSSARWFGCLRHMIKQSKANLLANQQNTMLLAIQYTAI